MTRREILEAVDSGARSNGVESAFLAALVEREGGLDRAVAALSTPGGALLALPAAVRFLRQVLAEVRTGTPGRWIAEHGARTNAVFGEPGGAPPVGARSGSAARDGRSAQPAQPAGV